MVVWFPMKSMSKAGIVSPPVPLYPVESDADAVHVSCALAGNATANGVAANELSVCVLAVRSPSVVQLILSVVSDAAVPVGNVGMDAVTNRGTLLLLSRQKSTVTGLPPGTSGVAEVNPVVVEVSPVGHVSAAPMANEAVAVVIVLGDKATVFDVRLANVTPPTTAATAPIVPTARTMGLMLRKLTIGLPPTLLSKLYCS